MLERHGITFGRELTHRVNELAEAMERLTQPEPQLSSTVFDDITVLNDGSGQLTLFRYRPVLEATWPSTCSGSTTAVEVVASHVGPLLFPAFDRFMLPSVRATGWWERDEAEYLESILEPGMRVLNVGANVGFTSLLMARCVGTDGLVVALEPEPLNYQLLCANLRQNAARNVLAIHAAAGEQTGSTTLQRSPDNSGDHRTAPHPVGIAPLTVPLVAIDELLPDAAIVDCVVIDAQGYDHRVIRGMSHTIERAHPPMLVEFWPPGILELGDDPDSALDLYRSLGYRIESLSGTDMTTLNPDEIVEVAGGDKDHATLLLVPAAA